MLLVLESHWVVREEHIFEEQCRGGSTMESFQLDSSVGHPLGWNEQSHFLCSDWLNPGQSPVQCEAQSSRRTMKMPKDVFHLSCPPSVALISFLVLSVVSRLLFQAHEIVYWLEDEYLEGIVISSSAKPEPHGVCWERACLEDRRFLEGKRTEN